ncbi:hypothetical protein FRB99_000845 [Tulasnella sp. 403]|nr:hypothetical protein FRB99_000845 [Tulasnella sp. 403]
MGTAFFARLFFCFVAATPAWSSPLAKNDRCSSLDIDIYDPVQYALARFHAMPASLRKVVQQGTLGKRDLHELGGSGSFNATTKLVVRSHPASLKFMNTIPVAELAIGTPPQFMKVMLDTGAEDLVVPVKGCNRCKYETFDPSLSESYLMVEEPFRTEYGDGCVTTGTAAVDVVSIGGRVVPDQPFGAVSDVSETFQTDLWSGLLGLGISTPGPDDNPSFFEELRRRGSLNADDYFFTLSLAESTAIRDRLKFGVLDEQLFQPPINYHPLMPLPPNTPEPQWWTIKSDGFFLDGNQVTRPFIALLDTGTLLVDHLWSQR